MSEDDRREELLQLQLDGELTEADRAELERQLDDDHSARWRARELEELTALLGSLGSVEPPASLIRNVMNQIHGAAPIIGGTAQPWPASSLQQDRMPAAARGSEPAISTTGGVVMRTKVLWGLAAAAAVLLAVFLVTGFPESGDGTEGAVGAAKRYQAGQIAAADVKLGDQTAQAFLQSDLFDRLMKDSDVRKALSDPALSRALADPSLGKALADPALSKALADPAFGRALADPALGKALADPALGKALADPAFGKALADPAFGKALQDNSLGKAINELALGKAINEVALGKALSDPALGKALSDPALGKALSDPALGKALSDPALGKALSDPALGKALSDPALGKALSDPALGKALSSVDLQNALKGSGLAAALSSPQFGEAFRTRTDR